PDDVDDLNLFEVLSQLGEHLPKQLSNSQVVHELVSEVRPVDMPVDFPTGIVAQTQHHEFLKAEVDQRLHGKLHRLFDVHLMPPHSNREVIVLQAIDFARSNDLVGVVVRQHHHQSLFDSL